MLNSVRTRISSFWNRPAERPSNQPQSAADPPVPVQTFDFDIEPGDTLLAYFAAAPGVVEIDRLELDSPALRAMKSAGVQLVVPLVSQGELIGLLNLGKRRSEQDYSTDDKRLLNTLATQAAPALRVAQLARQQQLEARERERVEQELRVARVIQETLLPKDTPDLPGWKIEAYWQPARAVSGDFYDFLEFPDGKFGIVVADVTDKGVPAALVMATARSLIRSAAERLVQPGEVLRRANDQLCPDIPPKMFVTCLYILMDPTSGEVILANAGHNLPIWGCAEGIKELRATGMPLGLMPGMRYDEVRGRLEPGDRLLLYSDGIVEAHDPAGDMYGFPRLRQVAAELPDGQNASKFIMTTLASFTGPDWEQEDDVTLLIIERSPAAKRMEESMHPDEAWSLLAEFTVPSTAGNERLAVQQVVEIAEKYGLEKDRMERLKTAVAETTMNAIEHGNQFREDLPVKIQVLVADQALMTRIIDHGGGKPIPEPIQPDLDAKLAGLQSPRGWGIFLIENMVDEMRIHDDDRHHIVDLIIRLEAGHE